MKYVHASKKISLSLSILTILSGITLISTKASADTEVIDQVRLIVPIACTMTGENTSHTATLDPGTYSGAADSGYKNGIGKTTLTAICNDDNGFSIYAIGYTGNQYEGENHTKLIGQSTSSTISTKAYANGDTASNWSMKLTKVTDSTVSYNPQNLTIQSDTEGSFDTWHSVPDAYTKVAEYHANTGSSTTDTTLGVKLETTYAAYISSSQPADTYVGQVKYTMVHPYNNTPKDGPITDCPANSICYSPNANDTEGTMGQQPITDSDTSTTLLASNFSRTGYGFAGWSDRYDYSNNNGAKFYGPQETISFDAGKYSTANGGLRLYAIWIKSEGSIQDSTTVSTVCNRLDTAPTDGTANLSSVSALTDQRDNNTYAIAKLADGKCWMIENLRLEAEGTRTPEKQALTQGYGTSTTYGNFSGLADAESANFSNSTAANSLYYSGTQSGDATINIGTSNYPGYRMPRYNNLNTPANANERPQNPTSDLFTTNNTTAGMYSYGNYYTWHAAIADLTYNGTNNQSTTNTSLCPTGWRLPLGGASTGDIEQGAADTANKVGGFSYLDRKMGGTGGVDQSTAATSLRWRTFPNNFLYSGNFRISSADNRGVVGYYWSSTANNRYNSYSLYLDSSFVFPGINVDYKHGGYSIRCTVSAGT